MRRINVRNVLVCLSVLALLATSVYAGVPGEKCCKKFDKKKAEKALRYLKEVEWPKTYREHDAKLLDRILGKEYVLIDGLGDTTNKQESMDYLKLKKPFHTYFKFTIKRLDIFENGTAVISGTGHAKGTNSKGEAYEFTYESSNVFILRKGVWKAISSHVSGVKEK